MHYFYCSLFVWRWSSSLTGGGRAFPLVVDAFVPPQQQQLPLFLVQRRCDSMGVVTANVVRTNVGKKDHVTLPYHSPCRRLFSVSLQSTAHDKETETASSRTTTSSANATTTATKSIATTTSSAHPNLSQKQQQQHESIEWVDESKHVELVGLITWMSLLSTFILINNFVGPWPSFLSHVHERVWFLGHMMGGMLFGGGVILTAAIEWLVTQNKNTAVLQFWFDKVPLLDMALVLPGLTLSMISGTGLSVVRYGGLAFAPPHIQYAFWALVAFAVWWAVTDLTTQGSALNAVLDLSNNNNNGNSDTDGRTANPPVSEQIDTIPDEVSGRVVSNVVSCIMVVVMYSIMVLKPGTLHYW